MKRKVGTIYNKSIVIGDKNLVTKNETHISELANSEGGGNSEVKEWYYKDISDSPDVISMLVILGVQTVLCKYRDNTGVGEASILNIIEYNDYSYSFYKKYFKLRVSDNYNSANIGNGDDGIDHYVFNPNKDLYERIDDVAKFASEFSELKDVIIEVSKEEYESQITYKNPYI